MSTPNTPSSSSNEQNITLPEQESVSKNTKREKESGNSVSKANMWIGIITSIVSFVAASVAVGAQWANMENKINMTNSKVLELDKHLDENSVLVRSVDERIQGMDKRIGKIEASFDVFLRMKKN